MLLSIRWPHFRQTPRLGPWLCCWGLSLCLAAAAWAGPVTYTVKSGDNPWKIAQKFDIPVERLLDANDLTDKSVLQVGQKLTIPLAGAPEPAPGSVYKTYTVQKNDTLSEIAETQEVSLRELLDANGLTATAMLRVGLVLRIPVEAPEPEQVDPNPDPVSHTLEKGESLWTVAKRYGVSVHDLARYNRIQVSQVLMPGQVLLIPGADDAAADLPLPAELDVTAPIEAEGILSLAAAETAEPELVLENGQLVHVIEHGDTVSHLAVKYRTTRQAIFEANRLGTRDVLAAGTKVIIPSGSLDADHERVLRAQDATRSKHDLPSRNQTMGQRVAKFAVSHLGLRYVWAGSNLKSGVDCSGFVKAVYQNFGISVPHGSKSQAKVGQPVKRSELQPGDIILFHTTRPGISHAGIYIGNNQFVHASTRGRKVQIDSLSDRYYDAGYVTARRML